MKEYIERAAAMEAIFGLTIVAPAVAQYANAVCYQLQNIPAADVAEVRHGRWVRDKWPSGTHKLICSECGEWSGKQSKYCPSCGARMDKEADHDKHSSNSL